MKFGAKSFPYLLTLLSIRQKSDNRCMCQIFVRSNVTISTDALDKRE